VTEFRHRIFTDAHLSRLEEIMWDVCVDFEVELTEFNGEDDHVHPRVNFPPVQIIEALVIRSALIKR
jgi:putative transposase